MIKLVLRSEQGDPMVMLGFTQRNVDKLTHGEPILVDLAELGIDAVGRLVISYGQDQAAIVQLWREAGIPLPDYLPEPAPGKKIRVEP